MTPDELAVYTAAVELSTSLRTMSADWVRALPQPVANGMAKLQGAIERAANPGMVWPPSAMKQVGRERLAAGVDGSRPGD